MGGSSLHPTPALSLWCICLFIAIWFSLFSAWRSSMMYGCWEKCSFHHIFHSRTTTSTLHRPLGSIIWSLFQPFLSNPGLSGSVAQQSGREASLSGESRAQKSWPALSTTWVWLNPGPFTVALGARDLRQSRKCVCIQRGEEAVTAAFPPVSQKGRGNRWGLASGL